MFKKFALLGLLATSFIFPTQIANADVVEAFDNATIQPAGPRSGGNGKNFFNVQGSGAGNFASYGIADFLFATPSTAQGDITTFSIALTESNAGFTEPGLLEFYLDASATLADIQPGGTSPLNFDGVGTGTAQDVTDGNMSLIALGGGPFSFTGTDTTTNGTVNTYNFTLSNAAETELLNRLNTGSTIRLVIAPGESTVAATWAGFSNNTFAGPTLTLNSTAVPEPSSIALLGLIACGAAARRKFKNKAK